MNARFRDFTDAIINPDYFFSAQFFTTPINSYVETHELMIEIDSAEDEFSDKKISIQVRNLEFPGYDDEKFENMECNKLSQEEINLLPTQAWW